MVRRNETAKTVIAHLDEFGIEFGKRYKDKASGFEGSVCGLYFFEHGCLRVNLRGSSKTTGEPVEATFDAPELIRVEDNVPVPASITKRGGPHGLAAPAGASALR